MAKWKLLFKLELKRIKNSIPSMLIGMVIFATIIAGLSLVSFGIQKNFNRDNSSYNIAMVESGENIYTDLVMQTIQSITNNKKTFKLNHVSEQKALDGLKSGKYDVAFIIPESFFNDMIMGYDTKIEIHYGGSPATVVSFMISDMTDVATNYVELSERCFYSMREFLQDRNVVKDTEYDLALTMPFINLLLSRNQIYSQKHVTSTDNISFTTYYICVGLIFIFLLLGLQSSGFLSRHQRDLERKLRVAKVNSFHQILAKYLALLLCYGALYLLIVIVILVVKPEYFLGALGTCFVLIPICAFLLFIYELIEDTANAILTLFVLTISLGFISGFFFPLSMLPKSFVSISSWMVTRIMLDYAQDCMLHQSGLFHFCLMILHSIALILLTVIIRNYKLRK